MSDHIVIRRTQPSDAEALATIFSGPLAIAGTMQLPYPSVEAWREKLNNRPEGMTSLLAEVDGEVVGSASLHTYPARIRRRHAGSIGMAVRDDWHSQGVGTALMAAIVDIADNWYNLHRLELEVYVDNAPALRLYQKFGFEIEGTMRDYAFRDGRYVDTHVMGRLRPLEGGRAG